jgi:hypothetical protein
MTRTKYALICHWKCPRDFPSSLVELTSTTSEGRKKKRTILFLPSVGSVPVMFEVQVVFPIRFCTRVK